MRHSSKSNTFFQFSTIQFFMLFACSYLSFFIILSEKLLFSGLLAFLLASSGRRHIVLEHMWTPACIESFCKSKLVFRTHFLQFSMAVWIFS